METHEFRGGTEMDRTLEIIRLLKTKAKRIVITPELITAEFESKPDPENTEAERIYGKLGI